MAAILGTIAKKAVIEVGAPSYTSGVHMWNGTAEILKAKPTRIKIKPNIMPRLSLLISLRLAYISLKFVEPVNP